MITNMNRPGWRIGNINDLDLQSIADYLRDLVRAKNYKIGDSFEARDIVGHDEIKDWAKTPLNIILQSYKTPDTQGVALGKIFKRTLFDDQTGTYEMGKQERRGKTITVYTKIK